MFRLIEREFRRALEGGRVRSTLGGSREYHPQDERVVVGESFLLGYSQRAEPFGITAGGNNGFDVLLSLKKAGEGLGLIDPRFGCDGLHAEEVDKPVRYG